MVGVSSKGLGSAPINSQLTFWLGVSPYLDLPESFLKRTN